MGGFFYKMTVVTFFYYAKYLTGEPKYGKINKNKKRKRASPF